MDDAVEDVSEDPNRPYPFLWYERISFTVAMQTRYDVPQYHWQPDDTGVSIQHTYYMVETDMVDNLREEVGLQRFVKHFLSSKQYTVKWQLILATRREWQMKADIQSFLTSTLQVSGISPTGKVAKDMIVRVAEAVMQLRTNYLRDDSYPSGLKAKDVGAILSHHATKCSETIRLDIPSVIDTRNWIRVWNKMKDVFGDLPQYYFGRAWIRILKHNGDESLCPMPDLSKYLKNSEDAEESDELQKGAAGSSHVVDSSETSESDPEEDNPVDYDSAPWSVTELSSEDEQPTC